MQCHESWTNWRCCEWPYSIWKRFAERCIRTLKATISRHFCRTKSSKCSFCRQPMVFCSWLVAIAVVFCMCLNRCRNHWIFRRYLPFFYRKKLKLTIETKWNSRLKTGRFAWTKLVWYSSSERCGQGKRAIVVVRFESSRKINRRKKYDGYCINCIDVYCIRIQTADSSH